MPQKMPQSQPSKPSNVPKARPKRRRNRHARMQPVRDLVKTNFPQKAAVHQLAAFMIMPRESPSQRLPLISNLGIKTAVSTLVSRGGYTVKPNQFSSAGTTDEPASAMWLVCRSPICPLWDVQLFPAWTVASPLWSYSCAPLSGATSVTEFKPLDYAGDLVNVPTMPPLGRSPLGNFLMYAPAGLNLQLQAANLGATPTNINFNLRYWYNAADSTRTAIGAAVTGGSAAVNVQINQGCWVELTGVEPTTSVTIPGTATFGLTILPRVLNVPTSILLPSITVLEAANANLLYGQSRVSANSFLLTNCTPKLYKGGRFVAARIPTDGQTIWTPATVANTALAANRSNTWTADASTGVYTWTVPDQNSLMLTDYTTTYPGVGGFYYGNAVFDLRDIDYFNVIVYRGGTNASATTTQEFSFEYTQAVEYATTSQIVSIAPSRHHTADLENAIQAIAVMPPFKENPMHLAFARSVVARAARAAYPYIRPYLQRGLRAGYRSLRSYL